MALKILLFLGTQTVCEAHSFQAGLGACPTSIRLNLEVILANNSYHYSFFKERSIIHVIKALNMRIYSI